MKASTRALNGPDLFKDLISVLSPKFVVLGYWGPPSPPPGEDRFHPESRAAALIPLGAAVRIGSTPLNSVIAVTSDPVVPGVETIMTASSFCKSASVTAGKRLIICWKSGGPPPPALAPPGPAVAGAPAAGVPAAGVAAGWLPPAGPFSNIAILCAICGGSLRICDSGVSFTVTDSFAKMSLTVIVPAAAS